MPNKAAATLNRAAIHTFSAIPDDFIKTITFDNGKEFSGHKALAQSHECDIYFAHPYHSWERGLNEHPNGIIDGICLKRRLLRDSRNNNLIKSL
jgi:IS30 family transposase